MNYCYYCYYFYQAPALRGLSVLAAAVFISLFAAFPAPSRSQPFSIPPQAAECVRSLYRCGGDITNLYFPFWGGDTPAYCRHPGFELRCVNNEYTVMDYEGLEFRVLNLSQLNRTMTLARNDLWGDPCSPAIKNTTLSDSFFAYPTNLVANLTLLYGCSEIGDRSVDSFLNRFDCPGDGNDVVYMNDTLLESVREELEECKIVQVPVFRKALEEIERRVGSSRDVIMEELKRGFEVKYMDLARCYRCVGSGSNGSCGFDKDAEFECSCPKGSRPSSGGECVKGKDWKIKAAIGVAGCVAGVAIMCAAYFCYAWRKKRRASSSVLLSRNISSDVSSGKDLEKGVMSSHPGVREFTYEELVDATNNFDSSRELGDGGFGTVYKGNLKDGRVVAVKRLYENNYKRVEQFMNEVEILARVRHDNLVALYGCTSRHCRELLLVYEYIPNGTIADHLHGVKATPGGLPWQTRLAIAVDTASALAYLHHTEIVHRDVKSNNILLDAHFRVKVADFGLSRLFPHEVSHVSTAPQGTPGYVDPEYHQCYQLTSKSDVFSFGVVLVELISSLPAVDITRHRHDINLSTMAISRIQNHALHEIVDPSLGFDEDPYVCRTVTAVAELAFRCLQQEKDMRPGMDDVWEELKAIQAGDDADQKADDKAAAAIITSADDAVLLKNVQAPVSPDSVTLSWGSSRTTTPNASN